jgi:hypothetical protein
MNYHWQYFFIASRSINMINSFDLCKHVVQFLTSMSKATYKLAILYLPGHGLQSGPLLKKIVFEQKC